MRCFSHRLRPEGRIVSFIWIISTKRVFPRLRVIDKSEIIKSHRNYNSMQQRNLLWHVNCAYTIGSPPPYQCAMFMCEYRYSHSVVECSPRAHKTLFIQRTNHFIRSTLRDASPLQKWAPRSAQSLLNTHAKPQRTIAGYAVCVCVFGI